MKTYEFVEPHITGGHAVVTITEEQILKHMKKVQRKNLKMHNVSDEDLIDYFIVNHWCTERKENSMDKGV